MDAVPTTFLPASFDPKNLNILHQTKVYAASICAYLASLLLRFGYYSLEFIFLNKIPTIC